MSSHCRRDASRWFRTSRSACVPRPQLRGLSDNVALRRVSSLLRPVLTNLTRNPPQAIDFADTLGPWIVPHGCRRGSSRALTYSTSGECFAAISGRRRIRQWCSRKPVAPRAFLRVACCAQRVCASGIRRNSAIKQAVPEQVAAVKSTQASCVCPVMGEALTCPQLTLPAAMPMLLRRSWTRAWA